MEQRALGQLRADVAVLLRVMQEIDDLLEGVLGLVLARDVVKRLAGLRLDVDLGVRLAERHGIAAHLLAHPAEHEGAEGVEDDQRQHPGEQELDDRAHLLRDDLREGHARVEQAVDDLVIRRDAVGHIVGSLAVVELLGRGEGDLCVVDLDGLDLSLFEHREELGVGDLLDAVALNLREEQRVEQHDHDQRNDIVDDQRLFRVFLFVHSLSFPGRRAPRLVMAP